MKTNLFFLLILAVLAATACQEQIDVDKEKEAIIAVVNAESNAYLARDFETLSSYMVQDSLHIQLYASKWNFEYIVGWEDAAKGYEKDFANDSAWSGYENLRLERKNYYIKVYPQSAWAVFKTIYKWNEDTVEQKWKVIETRFLEKVDGEWKITYVNNVAKTGYEEKEKEKEKEAAKAAEPEEEKEEKAE
jgi:hypothetical protein